MDPTATTATGGGAAAGAAGGMILLIQLLIYCGFCALMWWKLFGKAGEPGWASIIPIYNVIVLLKIAGKPLWWIILFIIPVVNLIIAVITFIALAGKFGKGAGFAVGLLLLPVIFFPILGFGRAQYSASAPSAV